MARFKRLTALVVALALPTPAPAADLSPARWTPTERARLEAREAAVLPAETRRSEGREGLVAGTASPIAVRAGMEALRQGGTAADAAVATALTQITTMLGANVSYAGVAQLVYYDARSHRIYALDAGWDSWRGERAPATIPDADLSMLTGRQPQIAGPAGRKTLVPGFMAGMEAMHRRFGRLPYRDLFAPAIFYAEQGVPVTPLLGYYFTAAQRYLALTPEGRRFAYPDGAHVPAAGTRFVPPGLADFLRTVATQGARHMYRGEWARRYVATVRAAGGAASLADMARYRPRWTQPLSTGFEGAVVYGPGAPNSSGCSMLEALNLIGHSGPRGRYWQDAQAFRTTALALRVAMNPALVPLPGAPPESMPAGPRGSCAARLTPEFGAAAARAMTALIGGASGPAQSHHSASVVAIDRWGNVAALVHSSNTPLWGDSGLIVDGVPIPQPASIYRHELVRIAPGARVPTDMAPLIVLRNGRPELAVAAIGSSITAESVRLVASLAGGRGDALEAMAAPPLLLNYEQLDGPALARDEFVPAGRYPADFLNALRATGLPLREIDAQRVMVLRATAAVGMIGGERRSLSSGEVAGVIAFAEGY